MQLIFLRPGVVIAAAGFQFLDIARQPFRHRLINVNRMFGPARRGRGRHQFIEFIALAVGGGDNAQFQPRPGNDREKSRPDLAAVLVEGKFVKKDISAEPSGRVRVGGQGRHTGAVFRHHFQRPDRGIVSQAEVVSKGFKAYIHGPQVQLDAFFHRFARLPFSARKDDPAHAAAGDFGIHHVFRDLQRGSEGLAGLAGEHAHFEPAFIIQPTSLIRIEYRHQASPR